MGFEPIFPELVPHFCFEGEFVRAEPYGFGHINGTYAAYFRQSDGEVRRYLVQRINHRVFKDVPGLMENVVSITAHLRRKIVAASGDPDRETLTLVPTREEGVFHETADGDFWRAYVFIEGARTYEAVENLRQVYNVGKAFGNFQKLLADFPAERLRETIPNFHHTRKRFEAFVQAVERDAQNRAHTARPEIEFVERRVADTSVLLDLLERGVLPSRVTHNDTKLNNVMLDDETGEGICVIDLDTVMPGLSLYDFGDAVRYAANPAVEDERDLAQVCIDLEIYDRFARGFLEAARDHLIPGEMEYLSFSARLMTLECGIRFLVDYLEGDVYFRTQREGHNLDRCRTQFKMVEDMEAKFDQMQKIVARCC